MFSLALSRILRQSSSLTFGKVRANRETVKRMTKVAVLGAGNWGTAVARRVALNINEHSRQVDALDLVAPTIPMWTYEEIVHGRKLTDIINTEHENTKYLPGVKLPENVVACPNVVKACEDADLLIFVIPHQFLDNVLKQLKGHVKKSAIAVSMIKGLTVGPTGPILLSDVIKEQLELENDVVVAMGANVAKDVAQDEFVEITVACKNERTAERVANLMDSPCFRASPARDVVSVELCGALKNVIAMGAGEIKIPSIYELRGAHFNHRFSTYIHHLM
jgi:glycerol-3-phosphate dehydrogenase (NAD+)